MASWSVCIVFWLGVAFVAQKAVKTASVSQGNSNTENRVYEQQAVSKSRSRRMTVCRAGWREYQGSCYHLDRKTTSMTWHEAQQVCNDNGGHLPTISDAEENSFVLNMLTSSCPSTNIAYLGLHDAVKENHFRWVDDTSSSYVNWNSEPNNEGAHGSEEDCVHMYGESSPSKWNDISCTTKHDSCSICEDTPSCPRGWTPFDGKCFRQFHRATKVSWNDARAACRTVGADLVSINCAEDQQFLEGLMSGRDSYYIGFTDVSKEGTFYWSDGSKGSFTKWLSTEPNDAGGKEDCTHFYIGKGWNDLPCDTAIEHYFACEM